MKKAAEINETIAWQDMTIGCEIYEPGTSELTKTGEWRSRTPENSDILHKVCQVLPSLSHPASNGFQT